MRDETLLLKQKIRALSFRESRNVIMAFASVSFPIYQAPELYLAYRFESRSKRAAANDISAVKYRSQSLITGRERGFASDSSVG